MGVLRRVAGWTVAGAVTREIFLAADYGAKEVACEAGVLP